MCCICNIQYEPMYIMYARANVVNPNYIQLATHPDWTCLNVSMLQCSPPIKSKIALLVAIIYRNLVFMTKVLKKDGQIRMTCKAYNGRCVLEWLASCLCCAVRNPNNNTDERLPVASVCMTLVRIYISIIGKVPFDLKVHNPS